MAGSVLRCSSMNSLLMPDEVGLAEWCLLLAGWDGRMLPVAAVPLVHGPTLPPAAGTVIRPSLDAPLYGSDAEQSVLVMHLQPTHGRLWALFSSGELVAWDLLRARSRGRWRPRWPESASHGFQPVAMCEDSNAAMVVLGHGGRDGEAVLVRAQLTASLKSDAGKLELNSSSVELA